MSLSNCSREFLFFIDTGFLTDLYIWSLLFYFGEFGLFAQLALCNPDYPDNLRMISLLTNPLQLNLGTWKKALCPKIGNNSEVSTSESFMPLDYALHSCMY